MSKPKAGIVPGIGDLQAMWQASGLKQKLIFTILMVALYRLGVQVPIWGVDPDRIQALMSSPALGFLDMFSGGALASVSILALGIGPYITASIIMQLMAVVIPRLEELQKEEGEAGRRKISQYTRYLTVALALFQGALVMRLVVGAGAVDPGLNMVLFYAQSVITLAAGAVFALWVAEMITERGVGNGGSLLIFVGIVSSIPFYWEQTEQLVANDPERSFMLVLLLLVYLLTIGFIIVLQESVRKIFIVSAKRQVGNRVYGGQNTHIPFKINPAGVMPIIFAFAVLAFPSAIMEFLRQQQPGGWAEQFLVFYSRYLQAGTPLYLVIEFAMIVFFTFFYASIVPSLQPKEIADNLKKYGSAIPGIKPGRDTAEKLEEILGRTTFIGAIGLALITLIAGSATTVTGITTLYGLGPTALLIMVGVALDTVNQIRVHLLARQYEGFLK